MEFSKQISEVVELCGLKVAKELCENYGGTKVYIRKKEESDLQNLSDEAQEALEHFAGEFIEVPKSVYNESKETYRIVLDMWKEGYSQSDIALAVECTDRQVRKLLKKACEEGQDIPTGAERRKAKVSKARQLFKKGMPLDEIARQIRYSESGTRRMIGRDAILTGV